MDSSLRILFIGSQWHGGDSAGLARAFRRLGHIVRAVDMDVYFPSGNSFFLKVVRKCFWHIFKNEFNDKILHESKILQPQFCVVYKGDQVEPQTLLELKSHGIYLILFYPDVSMYDHGPRIPKCLPLYDHIFTTKSYGLNDIRGKVDSARIDLLHHGFDPDVHRHLDLDADSLQLMGCDVAFIGTWSPKKERYLAGVAEHLPGIDMRIWGNQWNKSTTPALRSHIVGVPLFGDLYAYALQASVITIALLSERRPGSNSGDLATSRTFNIPACEGFMLHERTDEVLEFYEEGKEIACFGSPDELAEKITYYLNHPDERETIRLAGHKRCIAENSLDSRAQAILDHFLSRRAAD